MTLYVAAMDIEVAEILNNYPFVHISDKPKLYHLKRQQNDIYLVITGIGKVSAAYALTEMINKYNISAIYNIGFAGATQSFHQSDIICIQKAAYHDFDLSIFGYEKGQVPGFPQTFGSDQTLMSLITNKIGLPKAKLLTGDVFMTQADDNAYLVDMEGAALYQVAYIKSIPIISIKVVSDIIGMDKHFESYKQFEASYGSKRLKEVFDALI